ncbi:hypothetical protein [Pseudoduganella sp. R-34]|uniref:hypothetical protein n=1 Tax=unclassified Pseudoduganella TaxID=2637179 RepID=UPI003CED13CB
MFIGFIPFIFLCAATVLSLRPNARTVAQCMWLLSILMIVIWGVYHGSHHMPLFRTLSSW